MATERVEVWEDGVLVETRDDVIPDAVANARSIDAALETAIAYFGGNYRNWATLTATQKDQANRNAQRAVAQIARILRQRFDAVD